MQIQTLPANIAQVSNSIERNGFEQIEYRYIQNKYLTETELQRMKIHYT